MRHPLTVNTPEVALAQSKMTQARGGRGGKGSAATAHVSSMLQEAPLYNGVGGVQRLYLLELKRKLPKHRCENAVNTG